MAYSIGEKIVYGSFGVMTVVDLKEEDFLNEKKTYYLLTEFGRDGASITYVPLDNPRLVSMMRPILTCDEAREAIAVAQKSADLEWKNDNRLRSEAFKVVLESGDRAKILAMIRTIHNAGLRRAAIGKKNFLTDETMMKKAERLIASEFALSLNCSEADVRAIIESEIKGVQASEEV